MNEKTLRETTRMSNEPGREKYDNPSVPSLLPPALCSNSRFAGIHSGHTVFI